MKKSLTALGLLASVAFATSSTFADTKIGAIFDLTGGLNIYGIQQNQALELAIEKINADGGLLGKPVEVVTYDAQSELRRPVREMRFTGFC